MRRVGDSRADEDEELSLSLSSLAETEQGEDDEETGEAGETTEQIRAERSDKKGREAKQEGEFKRNWRVGQEVSPDQPRRRRVLGFLGVCSSTSTVAVVAELPAPPTHP